VYTVNCSILLTELPLLRRPKVVRNAGFEAVEYWWPFSTPTPPEAAVEAFIDAIREADVRLTGLNFAAGDLRSGDRGILSDPRYETAFRASVHVAIAIAEELGTRSFNALYGNRLTGLSPTVQDDLAIDNLAYAARAADRIGATVLIEPCSGARHYPLKTAADAVRVIDRLRDQHGVANVRLLADLYHLHVNGDDIGAVISDHFDRIGHVQIADAPGRGEPGTGSLPLTQYLRDLAVRGYNGWIGLEYKSTRVDPFDWLPRIERGRPSQSTAGIQHAETRTP
jgi:hydroxypyruvate isomerase